MALLVLLRIGAAVLNRDAPAAATPVPVPAGSHWIATWGAAPQAATAVPSGENAKAFKPTL